MPERSAENGYVYGSPKGSLQNKSTLFWGVLRADDGETASTYSEGDPKLSGRAWKFGDHVDTDAIIPARHCNTAEPAELAAHCMEDADPGFAAAVRPGDIIVAGANFGCGSSREVAPIAIKAAGVSAVVAASYARIFFRNAINLGLPIFECPAASAAIADGETIEIDPAAGLIRNRSTGETFQATPFPDFLMHIITAGGLHNYVQARLVERAIDAQPSGHPTQAHSAVGT